MPKRVQGTDSICPLCGQEKEDLEEVLHTYPELESPRRRNFVQVPPSLLVMSTDQADVVQFFRESSIRTSRICRCLNNNNNP
jgi:hypothetical protein